MTQSSTTLPRFSSAPVQQPITALDLNSDSSGICRSLAEAKGFHGECVATMTTGADWLKPLPVALRKTVTLRTWTPMLHVCGLLVLLCVEFELAIEQGK